MYPVSCIYLLDLDSFVLWHYLPLTNHGLLKLCRPLALYNVTLHSIILSEKLPLETPLSCSNDIFQDYLIGQLLYPRNSE